MNADTSFEEKGKIYGVWIRKSLLGDERAWNSLVAEFQRLVYSIPKRSGLGDSDCDDVFQGTFVALYRHLDRIDDPQTLPRWLATTASRETYRVSRRLSKQGFENLDEQLAAEDASAETMAIDAVQTEGLHRALAKLGGRCEQLLKLLYFEESAYQEIAERLKIAIGAIGPTRARCLDKLRRLFVG